MLSILYSSHSAKVFLLKALKNDDLDAANFIMEYKWTLVGWHYKDEDLVSVEYSSKE